MVISTLEKSEEEKIRKIDKKSTNNLTLDIAGAAIFGAFSIVLSVLTTEYLPRMSWGIAYFDPVSLIWISAFLIFGFRCGLMTAIIGMIGLMPFDPTPLVGPVMKFMSTIWFVLIPYLFLLIKKKKNIKPNGENLQKLGIYIPSMLLAWLIRSFIMILLNYLYMLYIWEIPIYYLDLSWIGIEGINGFTALIFTVFLLNTIQSVADAVIPYLIVYPTKIYDHFKIW